MNTHDHRPPPALGPGGFLNQTADGVGQIARSIPQSNSPSNDELGDTTDLVVRKPLEAIEAGIRATDAILRFAHSMFHLMIRILTVPALVVLRRQMGERFLPLSMPLVVFIYMKITAFFWSVQYDLFSCMIIAGLPTAGLILQYCYAFERDRKGKAYWHSYSDGISWLHLPVMDRLFAKWRLPGDFSKMFLEPLVVCLASIPLFILTRVENEGSWNNPASTTYSPAAYFVLLSGISLFIYQSMVEYNSYEQRLNQKDAVLEAKAQAALESGELTKPTNHYKGMAIVPRNKEVIQWQN